MSKTHGPHQGILGTLTKYTSKDNFRPPHEGDFGFTELLDALAGGTGPLIIVSLSNLVASLPWAMNGVLNTQAL